MGSSGFNTKLGSSPKIRSGEIKIESVELAYEVSDLENGFVDVMVEDISGYGYTVFVTNLLKVMNDNSVNFIEPEALNVVKQLTQQCIEEAINEYALNDGYCLRR